MTALVTTGFVRTMASYNAEMNRRLYDAASRIPDAVRRENRGAFWGSLHGTLCHWSGVTGCGWRVSTAGQNRTSSRRTARH